MKLATKNSVREPIAAVLLSDMEVLRIVYGDDDCRSQIDCLLAAVQQYAEMISRQRLPPLKDSVEFSGPRINRVVLVPLYWHPGMQFVDSENPEDIIWSPTTDPNRIRNRYGMEYPIVKWDGPMLSLNYYLPNADSIIHCKLWLGCTEDVAKGKLHEFSIRFERIPKSISYMLKDKIADLVLEQCSTLGMYQLLTHIRNIPQNNHKSLPMEPGDPATKAMIFCHSNVLKIIEDNRNPVEHLLEAAQTYVEKHVEYKLPDFNNIVGHNNNHEPSTQAFIPHCTRVVLVPPKWHPDALLVDSNAPNITLWITDTLFTNSLYDADYTSYSIIKWDEPFLMSLRSCQQLPKTTLMCQLWFGQIKDTKGPSAGRAFHFYLDLEQTTGKISQLIRDALADLIIECPDDLSMYQLFKRLQNISRLAPQQIVATYREKL